MVISSVQQRLDELLTPYDRTDQPGYVIGIRHRGETLMRRGFGMASIEQGVANSASTRMRIASTTKHFVALLALMLQEEGRLDLDEPIGKYLPELVGPNGKPTLRQLLAHVGGLRCYIDVSFFARGAGTLPKKERLASQARQQGVNFEPGDRMIYCNGGYLLVSLALERVTGVALAELLADHIFRPMRMHRTEMVLSDLEIHSGAATLHQRLPDGTLRRAIFPQEEMSGDGAVLSDVDDMLKWVTHLRGHRSVGSASAWRQMLECPTLNSGLRTNYSLGLMHTRYRGMDTVHHAGAVFGGSCQMLTIPSQELDIVVLSNGAPLGASKLATKLIDAVLGDELLEVEATSTPSFDFAHWIGKSYRAPSGLVLGFDDADGKLGVKLFGHDAVAWRRVDDRLELQFEDAAVGPLSIRLPANLERAPTVLVGGECGHVEVFDQLVPAVSQQAALEAIAGSYRCDDLDADIVIDRGDDGPRMRVQSGHGGTQMRLEPLSDNVWTCRNCDPLLPFGGVLAAQRDERGDVTGFTLDSTRTRHLRAERLRAR